MDKQHMVLELHGKAKQHIVFKIHEKEKSHGFKRYQNKT